MTHRPDAFVLEPLAPRHADFVCSLYAEPDVRRTLLHTKDPLSRAQALRMCETPPSFSGVHRFVGVVGERGRPGDPGRPVRPGDPGRPVRPGDPVGLGQVRARPDGEELARIGYSILPRFWGRGFATELALGLVRFARAELGLEDVRATTLCDNPASARVLAKTGFSLVGVETETDARGVRRRVERWRLSGLVATLALAALACTPQALAGEPITAPELAGRLDSPAPPFVLDVRTRREYEAGHIPGALNVPHEELAARLGELPFATADEVVVHCQSGRRADLAASVLVEAGYTNVRELEGHWKGWEAADLPVEKGDE